MTNTTSELMIEVELTGRTYEQRDFLKRHGWSWSANGQCWTKRVSVPRGLADGTDFGTGDASDPRVIFAKSIGANRDGCALWAGRQLIWASKSDSHRNLYMRDAASMAAHDQDTHDL